MAVHQPIIITVLVMVVLLTIRGTPATAIHSHFRNIGTVAGRRGGDGGEKIPAFAGRTIRGEIRTADIHNNFSKGGVQTQ